MSPTTLESPRAPQHSLTHPEAPDRALTPRRSASPQPLRPRSSREIRWFNYRKLFWKWHLYAGLFGAPLMVLIALTGAILVFAPEIDRMLRPDLWHLKPSSAAAQTLDQPLIDAVQSQFPKSKINSYRQNSHADEPYQFLMLTPGVRGIHDVWIDPVTREIIGDRHRETAVVRIAEQLHRRLLYGETGSTVIEFITGWCILLTLTGTYLWWPKSWRQLYSGLVPTTRGSTYKVNWRLHNVVGAWTAVVLLLLALSGMVFSTFTGKMYNTTLKWTGGSFVGVSTAGGSAPPQGATPVSIDTLLAKLANEVPPNTRFGVQLPREKGGNVVVSTLRPERATWADRRNYGIWSFNAYSGELIEHKRWNELHPLIQFRQFSLVLHFGSIFGLPTKIIAFVACLTVPILAVTGYLIWWWKRAGKSEMAKRQTPRRAAKPAHVDPPISRWVVAVLVLLCLIFPTIGVSFFLVVAFEAARAWYRSREAANLPTAGL